MNINILPLEKSEVLLSLIRAPRNEAIKESALNIQSGLIKHQYFQNEASNQVNPELVKAGLYNGEDLSFPSLNAYFNLLPYSPDKSTRVALELILVHKVPPARVCDMLDLAPPNISRLKKKFLSQVEHINSVALAF